MAKRENALMGTLQPLSTKEAPLMAVESDTSNFRWIIDSGTAGMLSAVM